MRGRVREAGGRRLIIPVEPSSTRRADPQSIRRADINVPLGSEKVERDAFGDGEDGAIRLADDEQADVPWEPQNLLGRISKVCGDSRTT